MPDRRQLKPDPVPPDVSHDPSQDRVILPTRGKVRVGYTKLPPVPEEEKTIHRRRPLPTVPERNDKD